MLTPRSRPGHRAACAVAGLVAVAVAGCTGDDDDVVAPSTSAGAVTTTTTPERTNDGVLELGVYLPRTGPGATLGEPMIGAVEEAIDLINEAGGVLGSPVRHEILDEGAGTGPELLLEEGVDAIIGPASSNVALSQLASVVEPPSGVVTCSPTATSLLLDDYPDNGLFFRTAPSDSLQMAAIARRARDTGVTTVAVGYLDDPYGRGLADAFVEEMELRGTAVVAEVGFSGDDDDLSDVVIRLLADSPGVVVVLGDADDGSRLLAALDSSPASIEVRRFIVNGAIREARQTIQGLSESFRTRLTGVAPLARAAPTAPEGPEGFFTSHAFDCVNLIALSAVAAESDDPSAIQARMSPVGSGGRVCTSFRTCKLLLEEGLEIDYNGASGSVELSNSAGDPLQAWFEPFSYDAEGGEIPGTPFGVSRGR